MVTSFGFWKTTAFMVSDDMRYGIVQEYYAKLVQKQYKVSRMLSD